MKGTGALTTVFTLTLPVLAMAHVSVQPRESKPGVEERYTIRVPTEGAAAAVPHELFISGSGRGEIQS